MFCAAFSLIVSFPAPREVKVEYSIGALVQYRSVTSSPWPTSLLVVDRNADEYKVRTIMPAGFSLPQSRSRWVEQEYWVPKKVLHTVEFLRKNE